ncbi:unnamed protein product [Acanthoscelides obtectus]|uniref:Uncharacterized protein n=1 Tax=Acanthoscelides obtectus TaxID=200917 RepID=A0A9P0PC87_ACAOB|nr:unnamed protein product [Acanthoscelides obtectus]CAK1682040.1 hypothetical protein AOBTE_LOCUS33396 [Acanthoscelides obtectus]
MSEDEEATGFSDDSLADQNYSPNEMFDDDSSSEDENPSDPESDSSDNIPLINFVKKRKWEAVAGARNHFPFSVPYTGVHPDVVQKLSGKNPVSFFQHFIDNEIITLLVNETNR